MIHCLLLAQAGCIDEEAIDHDPKPLDVDFHEVFVLEREIELQQSTQNPIGQIWGLALHGDSILIADDIQGDVKIFEASGNYVGAIGRPGPGPGEFRSPTSVVKLDDGTLAVYDRSANTVSIFDSSGDFVDRWSVGGSSGGNMVSGPDGNSLVIPVQRSEEGGFVVPSRQAVHVFSTAGDVLSSFSDIGPRAPGRRGTFAMRNVARVGGTFATIIYNSNEVAWYDASSGREWTTTAGNLHYVAPDWPAEHERVAETNVWAMDHMFTMSIAPISDSLLAIGIRQYDPTRARSFVARYSLMRLDGKQIAETSLVDIDIHGHWNDIVIGSFMNLQGEVSLLFFRLNADVFTGMLQP